MPTPSLRGHRRAPSAKARYPGGAMTRKRRSRALDHVRHARRKYARAYEPWTSDEDARLRAEHRRSNRELAKMFQRTPGAIRSRRKKLGLEAFAPVAGRQNGHERLGSELPNELERPSGGSRPRLSTLGSQPLVATQPTPPVPPVNSTPANSTGQQDVPHLTRNKRPLLALAMVAGLGLVFVAGKLAARLLQAENAEAPAMSSPGVSSGGADAPTRPLTVSAQQEEHLTIVTWNLRGYPEKEQAHTEWLHRQLSRMDVDVLCIQEVANLQRVRRLVSTDDRLFRFAFEDSYSSTDNAILYTCDPSVRQLPQPTGFQHPPQVAYVSYKGFDAVVASLHLSWKNITLRSQEVRRLGELLPEWRAIDPDVILAGDFNLTEHAIAEFAQEIEMQVMIPLGQEGLGTVHSGNRYDYFLISADLAGEEALSVQIETFSAADLAAATAVSDHVPVVARFRVAERFRDTPLAPAP